MFEPLKDAVDRAVERIVAVDTERIDRRFTVLQLLFVGVLLALTPQYSARTQLVPLVIGVPTFGMLAILLLIQTSARFEELVGHISGGSVIDLGDQLQGASQDESEVRAGRVRVLEMAAWLVSLFVLIVLVGFLVGMAAFLIAYYRRRAEQSWARSLAYSAFTWGFVTFIFEYVLDTPFYRGMVWIHFLEPILGV